MSRPIPTWVVHFTRVEHLSTIVARGLLSDTRAQGEGLLAVEVGNTQIKDRRSSRTVPVDPGGVVADYVPFYFAPRSPMMSSIHNGKVPTYQDGCGRLVYLVTTLEQLDSHALDMVLTDRNAVLQLADFWNLANGEPEADFIDWPLMKARYWFSTDEYPDRRERRMAECLVHGAVPFEAFTSIVTMNQAVADEAAEILRNARSTIPVSVGRDWYF